MSVKFSREFYGWDRFSKITLAVGIFLVVTRYAWILGTALIIYSIWKSKSTTVRGRNNKMFVFENTKRNFNHKMDILKKNIEPINIKKNMEIINSLLKKYKPMKNLKEKRKYLITSCPKCQQKLRLPKGKGKIIVTCSKCCSDFRLKT